MLQSLPLLCVLAYTVHSLKFIDLISKSTIEVLHGSQREETVRQCSCQEMSDCYESAKQQAYDCFDPCWKEIKTYDLTEHPEKLRVCFENRRKFVDEIITCFKTKIKACEDDIEKAKMVHVKTYDYPDMIKRVEDVINEQIQTFLNSITSNHVKYAPTYVFFQIHNPNLDFQPFNIEKVEVKRARDYQRDEYKNLFVQQVVHAGASVARCVKNCFIEKNKDGFCFDKKGCEPNIADRNAKLAIRQCSRQVNWKKEIGDLCTCSSQAGIQGISDYCGMLNIVG